MRYVQNIEYVMINLETALNGLSVYFALHKGYVIVVNNQLKSFMH